MAIIILCDRCGARTSFHQGALQQASVSFTGQGVVAIDLVSNKDLCLTCRTEVTEKLRAVIPPIFGEPVTKT